MPVRGRFVHAGYRRSRRLRLADDLDEPPRRSAGGHLPQLHSHKRAGAARLPANDRGYRARLTLPRTSTLVRGFMLPYKNPAAENSAAGRLKANLDVSDVLVCKEEQRQCAGADMGAGHRLVIDRQDFFGRLAAAAQEGREDLRVGRAVGVGDADSLVLRIHNKFLIPLGNGLDGTLAVRGAWQSRRSFPAGRPSEAA